MNYRTFKNLLCTFSILFSLVSLAQEHEPAPSGAVSSSLRSTVDLSPMASAFLSELKPQVGSPDAFEKSFSHLMRGVMSAFDMESTQEDQLSEFAKIIRNNHIKGDHLTFAQEKEQVQKVLSDLALELKGATQNHQDARFQAIPQLISEMQQNILAKYEELDPNPKKANGLDRSNLFSGLAKDPFDLMGKKGKKGGKGESEHVCVSCNYTDLGDQVREAMEKAGLASQKDNALSPEGVYFTKGKDGAQKSFKVEVRSPGQVSASQNGEEPHTLDPQNELDRSLLQSLATIPEPSEVKTAALEALNNSGVAVEASENETPQSQETESRTQQFIRQLSAPQSQVSGQASNTSALKQGFEKVRQFLKEASPVEKEELLDWAREERLKGLTPEGKEQWAKVLGGLGLPADAITPFESRVRSSNGATDLQNAFEKRVAQERKSYLAAKKKEVVERLTQRAQELGVNSPQYKEEYEEYTRLMEEVKAFEASHSPASLGSTPVKFDGVNNFAFGEAAKAQASLSPEEAKKYPGLKPVAFDYKKVYGALYAPGVQNGQPWVDEARMVKDLRENVMGVHAPSDEDNEFFLALTGACLYCDTMMWEYYKAKKVLPQYHR